MSLAAAPAQMPMRVLRGWRCLSACARAASMPPPVMFSRVRRLIALRQPSCRVFDARRPPRYAPAQPHFLLLPPQISTIHYATVQLSFRHVASSLQWYFSRNSVPFPTGSLQALPLALHSRNRQNAHSGRAQRALQMVTLCTGNGISLQGNLLRNSTITGSIRQNSGISSMNAEQVMQQTDRNALSA